MLHWRTISVLGFVAAMAVFGSGIASGSTKRMPKKLEFSNLLKPTKPFGDTILRGAKQPLRSTESPALPYTTTDGMTVYVSFSDS